VAYVSLDPLERIATAVTVIDESPPERMGGFPALDTRESHHLLQGFLEAAFRQSDVRIAFPVRSTDRTSCQEELLGGLPL
jgi:hypothetical protein